MHSITLSGWCSYNFLPSLNSFCCNMLQYSTLAIQLCLHSYSFLTKELQEIIMYITTSSFSLHALHFSLFADLCILALMIFFAMTGFESFLFFLSLNQVSPSATSVVDSVVLFPCCFFFFLLFFFSFPSPSHRCWTNFGSFANLCLAFFFRSLFLLVMFFYFVF